MKLAFATTAPQTAAGDVLVLFSRPQDSSTTSSKKGSPATARLVGAESLPAATVEHIEAALATLKAKGNADEVVRLPAVPKVAAPMVVVTGLGSHDSGGRGASAAEPTHEQVRRAAGAAARSLLGTTKVVVALPVVDVRHAGAVAGGIVLGGYRFDAHRGADARAAAPAPISSVTVVAAKKTLKAAQVTEADITDAVAAAEVVARHQCFARDLVNTAPNELYPASFAAAVKKAAGKGVTIEVLDEKQLTDGGFGGLMAVGRGSSRPPRLVKMSYEPKKAAARLAYVGKGITFDSGGLSLKPAASMMTMKMDMGGAAAVAASVMAIAELGMPVAVTGYLCLAENMPSGDASRPGDVVTQRGGTTVEILNTDAEGRLVLADGIALAAESSPDAIVDIATLTGAAIVALGKRTAAVLANDDAVQGALTEAATEAGESVWPLPIAEEIRSHIDSTVADIKNIGETGTAGTLAAAAFLREFAVRPTKGGKGSKGKNSGSAQPWGHLDIAGPAYHEGGPYGYTLKGGTGFGVPTLVSYAARHAG